VSAFLQVISEQDAIVKGCGRVCADMLPTSLPIIPVAPPLSIIALLRERPDMVFRQEWLAAMDTHKTVH